MLNSKQKEDVLKFNKSILKRRLLFTLAAIIVTALSISYAKADHYLSVSGKRLNLDDGYQRIVYKLGEPVQKHDQHVLWSVNGVSIVARLNKEDPTKLEQIFINSGALQIDRNRFTVDLETVEEVGRRLSNGCFSKHPMNEGVVAHSFTTRVKEDDGTEVYATVRVNTKETVGILQPFSYAILSYTQPNINGECLGL